VKVAVIHDWLGPMTGAERVLEQILRCYPGADLFTAIDFLAERHRGILQGSRVTTSFIQHLPHARTSYWKYIPLMPFAFEAFDLRGYDLVISNSHTAAKGIQPREPRAVHVCYLETPMRFAWDLEAYYLRAFRMHHGLRKGAARLALAGLRRWDLRSVPRVDKFVAVSKFVAKRCETFYGRQAAVQYPPVDVDFFTPGETSKDDFFLVASRLTPFKCVDLIVETFRALPNRKLVVIGEGPERDHIAMRCPSNVTLLGYQPDEILRDYMRRARAFLFPAPEDFGIVMAEALACGTPVIALGHGGALEIVRGMDTEAPTGAFFDLQSVDAVLQAIACFEREESRIRREDCRTSVTRFAPHAFRDGLRHHVDRALDGAGSVCAPA
jgi:glycosyltransferase involved in cell wall biosynthesis